MNNNAEQQAATNRQSMHVKRQRIVAWPYVAATTYVTRNGRRHNGMLAVVGKPASFGPVVNESHQHEYNTSRQRWRVVNRNRIVGGNINERGRQQRRWRPARGSGGNGVRRAASSGRNATNRERYGYYSTVNEHCRNIISEQTRYA